MKANAAIEREVFDIVETGSPERAGNRSDRRDHRPDARIPKE